MLAWHFNLTQVERATFANKDKLKLIWLFNFSNKPGSGLNDSILGIFFSGLILGAFFDHLRAGILAFTPLGLGYYLKRATASYS